MVWQIKTAIFLDGNVASLETLRVSRVMMWNKWSVGWLVCVQTFLVDAGCLILSLLCSDSILWDGFCRKKEERIV